MSIQGISLIFSLLFMCFFRESFCICDGTIWTKVGWEIFPEEMHYLKLKKQAAVEVSGNAPESQPAYDIDQILCKLVATTSMMTKYLNQMSQNPPAKKAKHHKLRGRRVKEEEEPEDNRPHM
ncbi:testis-expressed protein 50 isoform X2 [Talpa occidentalis]|uniref:testis-expressed protein 50 isoform X2 n=1 Tax=Talpa occidentalis TaxID=50954 RepID=UPI0023F88133|nr:testis-expressed protein 50 isoform X2 [Talpa occidentalis]